jgi:hypothetical protein
MRVHIAIFWTIVLAIIASIPGGVTHMFSRPTNTAIIPPASFSPPRWARS